MAKLRFEIWDSPRHAAACAAVSESWDRVPDERDRVVEVFFASTHGEAMSHYYERMGWGAYDPVPGVTDQPFTDKQLAEQEAYLAVRPVRWRTSD